MDLSPELDLKVSSRFTTSLGAESDRNRNDVQYFGTFTDAAGAAALHLRPPGAADAEPHLAAGLHLHADHVAPDLRLALHLQGDLHRRARSRPTPAAARTSTRYRPYADPAVAAKAGGFNFQQFRSNVVFRWEYRAGSTLFLVWSQGRQGLESAEGTQGFGRDLQDLFGRRAADTFLIKLSYWLAR